MKNLIILFLFLLNNIYAQSIITGRVFSSSSKQPLHLANVVIKGTTIGTSTDENGKFTIKGEFKNTDKLVISYLGYEPKEILIDDLLKSPDKNIFLESKLIISQTVLVKGSIAKSGITPISYTKLERSEIADAYTYQDIPEILSYTPSTTFYSENGNGLGYNYLSIRGFDQRRISVSINGIPQNDPEDHNVYWIDFPDLLESTELIQVQRGAGSGIAGYAAIGGAINIITSTFSDQPRVEFSSSIGSFNTRKYSATVSSGLINNKYSVYAKLSQTLSSGYRNSSWVDLKSYHLSAVRYDDNLITQINIFGGPIADGLAYTGLPKFAIKDKNLRKANYSYWEADEKNYTYTLERRPDEIENFSQPHFELLNELKLNDKITFNSALFLVLGNGFFDYDGSWGDTTYFRLTKENGFYPTQNPGNVLIRAMVENKQWGWIPRASIKHNNGELIIGGEFRFHNSIHWGSINYGENLPQGLTKDFRYYYYEGEKDILNFFVNENYQLSSKINLLAEAQLSYHNYKIKNERYVNNNFSIDDLYFNPRFGINYRYSPDWNFYFSFARVTREPRLKNYYDAAESSGGAVPQFETKPDGSYDFSKPLVKPETMNNFEFGSSFSKENLSASLNLFYMLFNDEIVKRGQVDRFGQPITGNMERTIHYGLEGTFSLKHNDIIELTLNGSLSKNYISSGAAYFYNKKTGSTVKLDLSGNRISGFPDVTINAILKINYENLLVQLTGKYVGSFFTDNYDNKLADYLKIYSKVADYTDNKVDAYFVANFYASYNLFINSYLKNIKLYMQINNIFDNLYAAYGIGKEFFPAAERNYLFGVKIGL